MQSKSHLTLIDRTIAVDRPIGDVFAFVSNHENYALWFPGVISIVSETDEPHGTVGKVYAETIRMPSGRERLISIPVVESRPPYQFATEGVFAPLHPRMEFQLEALGDAQTQVRWIFSSRATSWFGKFMVRRLAAKRMASLGAVAMPKLKAVLEQPELV